jgi:glycosyltransferase involved in cell wall biosynthesis
MAQVERLELTQAVRFVGHVKARDGFAKGRLLVVPSRGDSMPYVVIEAGAAGMPMIGAEVGGIPEIFGPHRDALFAPNNADALANAIEAALAAPTATSQRTTALRERVFQHFSQSTMVEGVLAGYREAFTKS